MQESLVFAVQVLQVKWHGRHSLGKGPMNSAFDKQILLQKPVTTDALSVAKVLGTKAKPLGQVVQLYWDGPVQVLQNLLHMKQSYLLWSMYEDPPQTFEQRPPPTLVKPGLQVRQPLMSGELQVTQLSWHLTHLVEPGGR